MVLSCNRASMIVENQLEFCHMVSWNSARVYNASTAREVYYDNSIQFLRYSDSSTQSELTSDILAKGKIQTFDSIIEHIENRRSF